MWHRVDVVLTDVSEERIASIFRVEGKIRKSAGEETVRTGTSRLMLEINSTDLVTRPRTIHNTSNFGELFILTLLQKS
jgi:hypothetical protein